jgi:hypothetical protein
MKSDSIKKAGLLFLVFSFLFGTLYTPTPVYAALNPPALIAPANGSTKTASNTPPLGIPELKWDAVAGATSYQLQLSRDAAFTVTADIVTTNTTFSPYDARDFTDGTWYWRVRVQSPAISFYSNAWTFIKQWATPENLPVLIGPANGATIDFYDTPSFSWTSVTGASSYLFQLYATHAGWASSLLYNAITLSTSVQPHYKMVNGTSYYWRVVPVDFHDHQGTPSQERTFNASYNFVPTLLEPVDNSTPTFTPTFRWTAVKGAQFYELQYTTDSSFNSSVNYVPTTSTTFTPTDTLPNDVNYYWRVRSRSGLSLSDWSPIRQFVKRWYIKPLLLTPTLLYQKQRFPFFSWTPVPAASFYNVQVSTDPNFSNGFSINTANTFLTTSNISLDALPPGTTYYWRVTPYEKDSVAGVPSNNGQYVSYRSSVVPDLAYPLYYYPPNAAINYPGFPGVKLNPSEDRAVPLPIFIWNRVYQPVGMSLADEGDVYAKGYLVQVDDNSFFTSVNWSVNTENTFAAPTVGNPFTPAPNTNYYWRVCPYVNSVTECTPVTTSSPWSQVWKTQFNLTKGLTPKIAGSAPELIRPTSGFEFADATPLLEWFPISGATAYDVQISLDQAFGSTVDTATVTYPVYAPTQSFAQRSLNKLNFGVYYWRVRQSPGGSWSSVRRFQISAQSQWRATRNLGDPTNRLQIGSDLAGDTSNPNYDLTDLNVAQASQFWHFGFHIPTLTQHVTYALYLDLDHADNSGATFDAFTPAYNISTISTYRPEYAIYILDDREQTPGVFDKYHVFVYEWPKDGTHWNVTGDGILGNIGGDINYNSSDGYLELTLPNVGYQDTTGSFTASLLSLSDNDGASPEDSVPSDPNVPGAGPISRFANVTERLNLVAPPNNGGVDPYTYPSVQPFFWDRPAFAPVFGSNMQISVDEKFSSVIRNSNQGAGILNLVPSSEAPLNDIIGDNSYYWRVQPAYNGHLGVWSQGSRFERKGLIPQNLQTSVTFATPTFSWDMVEGAESYDLQVDKDPNFSLTQANSWISVNTKQNSYTNLTTLVSGVEYYWRVKVHRNANPPVLNSWSPAQTFTLALPAPTGLTPASGTIVAHIPTLCWTPILKNSPAGDPVLAAWKYQVQVSRDATFSVLYDFTSNNYNDSTEQNCWTPFKGYDDGTYYWRVAMRDGNDKQGTFSATNTFTKQYPTTTLINPSDGSSSSSAPTFTWSPVDGAAYYRLEISQFPTFSPLYDSVWTESTRFTPTFTYAVNQTYYWRVAMLDRDSKFGPFNTATIILKPPTNTFVSIGAHDGWTLESSQTSGRGSAVNNSLTYINLGDDASKKQYRSILSFSTGDVLPDTAIIETVMLKVKKHSIVGSGDPVALFQGFLVDIKTGFFGGSSSLEGLDFQSAATKNCGPYAPTLTSNTYNINLTACGKTIINKTAANNGLTQIRMRFKLDDNNNSIANILKLYSGNATTPSDRPQLVITYHLP